MTFYIITWLLLGVAAQAWFERYLWVKYPQLREDITLCHLVKWAFIYAFMSLSGPIALFCVAFSVGLWPLTLKCPVIYRVKRGDEK